MSDSISSTNAQSSTSTEQSSRGRHNRGGRAGGRPYHRRGQGERHSENSAQSSNGICKFDKFDKTEQTKVIFTRDPEKPFQDYKDTDVPFKDEKLNIFCEDEEIYEDIMVKLRYNCPGNKCEVVCDGWQDLKKHLDKHYIEGDETGFTGHPRCDFCCIDFYGDDELYEHCRNSHEQCHICLRAGIRHQYYINYNELEQHFRNGHFLCLHQECLDKKFVVFETDIDLKAHELETHGSYISGQRAKQHEARRIEVNFISYGESLRNRRRNQERQGPENRNDYNEGGRSAIEEVVRQIQNINVSESNSSMNGGTSANVRAVRPPPGFGVLSSNEVIGPPDEPPPQTVQRNRTPNPIVPRVRDDEFPTLSAASRVTSNAGIPPINYSEKVRANRSSMINKPRSTMQQRSTLNGDARSSSGTSSKGKELAHVSENQTTIVSDIPNHNQRVKNNGSVISSRQDEFLRRVNGYLSNNKSKMNEFCSIIAAYRNEAVNAQQFIEALWNIFNKRIDTIGKVVSGFVDVLDNETKKSALLSAWNDRKSMVSILNIIFDCLQNINLNSLKINMEFPALEPLSSPPQAAANKNPKT
ncbi:9180_t:CDS:2, partial [Dentiscutata erythropus]